MLALRKALIALACRHSMSSMAINTMISLYELVLTTAAKVLSYVRSIF
jgi:hypothetical protein